jgi:type IV pilus assembly protein PilB
MSDPTNGEVIQELAFHTGLRIRPVVASASSIDRAIRRYYYGETTHSVPTAAPGTVGASEPEFDAAALDVTLKSPPPTSELAQKLAEMTERVGNLEKLVTNQGRALRCALELLMAKSVVTRDEYQAKLRGVPARKP